MRNPCGRETTAQVSGVAKNYFRAEQIQGVWGTEVPSGVQRRSPGGGLGAKPPEADDFTIKYVQLYSIY